MIPLLPIRNCQMPFGPKDIAEFLVGLGDLFFEAVEAVVT